jgi:acyl carrier protein
MTREEIRSAVLEAIGTIAPEADLASLRAELPLRDQLDLDSMDVLNLVTALHHSLGVDIPEADYPRLATLQGCVDYLGEARPCGPR